MKSNEKLARITSDLATLARPPRRISVSDLASENLYVSSSNKWDPTITPYMIRPMDESASRRHDVVCFVGPARTGKTLALILGRYLYSVLAHPQDFAVIHSSQDLARDFAIRELARLHRWSANLARQITDRKSDYNIFDKTYRNGVMGILGWPSSAQLASRTLPVMLLTDYGRWPADIGGEGSGFLQARKRTQTAGSLAMTIVESSPGEDAAKSSEPEFPKWELGKPIDHSFPTVAPDFRGSICQIYENGTREWWYVPCASCGEYYPQNPSIERFSWPQDAPMSRIVKESGTICPWCGTIHREQTKRAENENGVWLAAGETIDCYGVVRGESAKGHTYPSFALGGGAAAYQKRGDIVQKYLQGMKIAQESGDELTLKNVVNADIGAPYRPLQETKAIDFNEMFSQRESVAKRAVPEGAQFIVCAVDVQADRFVVQMMGYGQDRNRWLIDRFNIRHTERGENTCRPAVFEEDWLLLDDLFHKSYSIPGTELKMLPAAILCDSAGAPGVTEKAYAFYRRLRPAMRARFRLVKGIAGITAPMVEQRYPNTAGRSQRGKSQGDIPVIMVHSDKMKDRVYADLQRMDEGPGRFHFPDWLGKWFFKELYRETRDKRGHWHVPAKGSNEAIDLTCYAEAGAIFGIPFSDRPKGIDNPSFWSRPPLWADKTNKKNPCIFENGAEIAHNKNIEKPTQKPAYKPRKTLWS